VSVDLAAKAKENRAIFVLIPLLLLHLVLLSLQIENPGGTLFIRHWIAVASSPFLKASDALTNKVKRVWTGYVWLHGAREENQQLREMVRQLTLRDNATAQLKGENTRLRSLLGLSQSMSVESIGARVIGRMPNYLSHVAFIDRGEADGVRMDSAVLSENGAFGRTVLVLQHNSQVQLISNTDSSIGVMLESSRLPGVLRGLGDQRLSLQYISNSEQVNAGERVFTSGLDGIFPKGIPVGMVVESRKGKSVFRDIEVEPFSDLVRTEEVLVLLAKPKSE
jgi:rod shape-determining protein MreC